MRGDGDLTEENVRETPTLLFWAKTTGERRDALSPFT